MRIVFMGTPDFAVPCLLALNAAGHGIAGVVCQPDRPKGRGRRVQPPPVKEAALGLGVPVYQPESVKGPEFCEEMAGLSPDLFVVVAFGHLLPRPLLDLPRLGAVNVHASLLPRYRGPAPIQWALANGDEATGVCTMRLDTGMDTGDVYLCETVGIREEDTAGTLHDRLAEAGAGLLVRTVQGLEGGSLSATPQDHGKATYARALAKSDGVIDWNRTARELDCHVRGMNPWPGAVTDFRGKRLKVYMAKAVPGETEAAPGTVVCASGGALHVACGRGILSLLEVQSASGKRLLTEDFLRGADIAPGEVLG